MVVISSMGKNRWIGIATHSAAVIIWAKIKGTKEIKGFIVDNGTKGMICK